MSASHIHLPVVKTMWPMQPGALKLSRRYGPNLVCVRYRHDASGKTRYTTVELVIEEAQIQRRIPDRKTISVRLLDPKLRARARALGAKWSDRKHTWQMSLRVARNLGILDETR
jgi:hypothetical protein